MLWQVWFLDSNRSMNCKKKMFKVFVVNVYNIMRICLIYSVYLTLIGQCKVIN